jgi:UDP-N-acetylglucosamine 4,6-dehydratase
MALAIVQARMGSERLPGKVLKPVVGSVSMLEMVVSRVKMAASVAKVVVATSDTAQDKVIQTWCSLANVDVYQGPEHDVLKRFVGCAAAYPGYPVIIRITGDCPLVDPTVIDAVAERRGSARYARNTWFDGAYPSGFDCEFFTLEALQEHHLALAADDPAREHVMSAYRPVVGVPFESSLPAIDMLHLSVDTNADLELVRRVLERMKGLSFGIDDVIACGHTINLQINITEARRTLFAAARRQMTAAVAVQSDECIDRIHPVALAYLTGKRVLITGGTGSLGSRLLQRLLGATGPSTTFVVVSRDELKQSLQQEQLSVQHKSRTRHVLADVRDKVALAQAFRGCDIVVHAAALKHVAPLEDNPREAIATNIIGTMNVLDAAEMSGVQRVICLSTDKAAAPCNTYGCSKMMLERLAVATDALRKYNPERPRVAVIRYGNVVGSRGSVIPLFNTRRQAGQSLPVTSFNMTRFTITLDQATVFVLNCLAQPGGGQIFVPMLPKYSLRQLVDVAYPDCETTEVGIRPGEKLHECMVSPDELHRAYIRHHTGPIVIEPSTAPRRDLLADEARLSAPYTSENAVAIDSATLTAAVRDVR